MIKLVTISELFGKRDKSLAKNFIISSYQRGYRWNIRQVQDLLDDFYEFMNRPSFEKGEFYCLQPLIVKKIQNQEQENTYEVIDGQQRLTTLYLLFSCLKGVHKIMFPDSLVFSIQHQTRKDFGEFLLKIRNNISDECSIKNLEDLQSEADYNVDKTHALKAAEAIVSWISNKPNLNRVDFLNMILREGLDSTNVRFIWYEVNSETDSIEIFTRINIGKIPLTSTELIKALFFVNKNNDDKSKYQLMKAYEWENIELTFRNDNFWAFLVGARKHIRESATRQDLLFEIIADDYKDRYELGINVSKDYDRYYSFYIFNEYFKQYPDKIEIVWEEVKSYFRILNEIYEDNIYYHLVGFLLQFEESNTCGLRVIIKNYQQYSKKEFEKTLREKIKEKIKKVINENRLDLSSVNYDNDKKLIKNILLLFNIIVTMRNDRFPLDKFLKNNWSLEHIHPRSDDNIDLAKINIQNISNDFERYKKYIKLLKLSDEEQNNLIVKIETFIKKFSDNLAINEEDKKNLFELLTEINNIFKGDTKQAKDEVLENIDNISNLTLLPININSSLSNKIFPEKRELIIQFDAEGFFIPICTKYVFLKYFKTNTVEYNPFLWTIDDMREYEFYLKQTIESFLFQ